MKLFNKVKQYMIDNIKNDRFKYGFIIYCIASVHIFLIFLFLLLRVYPLVIFNIGSVILYIRCANSVKIESSEKTIKIFFTIYWEIILHSFVTTVCIGWHFGFTQYIIGLVPFSYYICITMMKKKNKYLIGTILSVISFFSFIGCRIISTYADCLWAISVSPHTELFIYIFNAFCNFLFLFLITLIFIMDMQGVANELTVQNTALDKMASVDPLTGLYNRRSMRAFFDQAIESESPFCLVMCDIDDFKKCNDNYGHDFGDLVLKEITHIIHELFKDHGYVCRWGGEEILILSNELLDPTCKIAENIRRDVEKHDFMYNGNAIHVTLTLGVAAYKVGNTIADTIMHADNRLYYGKKNGKNRVVTPYDAA